MKKKDLFKKVIALSSAAVLFSTMTAGCGSSSASSASTASSAVSSGAVSAVSSASTAASGSTKNIGYVNLADTDVFCMARETALNTLIEGTNYKVTYTDGNNDNQKQIDQTNAFLAKGVDGLILVPSDSAAIVPAITAANAANVPVICFGIKASSGNFTFVGSDSYEAGKMQADFMAEKLPQGAKILYCAGTAGLEHSALRRSGFQEELKAKGRDDIQILEDQDCDYVKDKAMQTCDAWIQTYSDGKGGVTFNAIVCANDQMALGCMESLKGAGVLTSGGEVLITGIDGTDDAIKAVADGYMAQTVLQDAAGQAKAAFEVMQKLVNGEKTDSEVIVPFQSITKDNVAQYEK